MAKITVSVSSLGCSEPSVTVDVAEKNSCLLVGLQSWYDLEDAKDAVGGRALTNTNGTAFAAGKTGNAATFTPGSGQSLAYNSPIVTGGENAFTVAGWVKTSGTERWKIIDLRTYGETCIYRTYGNDLNFTVYDTAHRPVTVAYAGSGEWCFFSMRYNPTIGSHGRFDYSVKYGTTTNTGSYSPVAVPLSSECFRIGGTVDADARGQVDSAGLWSRALTDAELLLLWNSGSGLSYSQL